MIASHVCAGEVVRTTCVIDAHNREGHRLASVVGTGISGAVVRDMVLEAVDFAAQLNLIPCFTRVASQSPTACPRPLSGPTNVITFRIYPSTVVGRPRHPRRQRSGPENMPACALAKIHPEKNCQF